MADAGRSVIDGCVPDLAGDELEPPSPGDRREQKRRLHHRERGADAFARPQTERDERPARQPLLEAVEPALGAERVGLGKNRGSRWVVAIEIRTMWRFGMRTPAIVVSRIASRPVT